LIVRSDSKNFHTAIRVVPHPPGNAQHVGLALHKPTEAYALYTAANEKFARFGFAIS
jgi:hypothetical protein